MKETNTSKKTSWYQVANSDYQFPLMTVEGKYPGPTLLITAGIHGGEYPGIEACRRLFPLLDPEKIHGQVTIIPCVNTAAFYERLAFYHPDDLKNLNRSFPGDSNGSAAKKIAAALFNHFITKADFYLDFHSGDLPEKLGAFVFIPSVGDVEIIKKAEAAANYLNLPFGVKSSTTNGTYGSGTASGTPALLIERGGHGERQEKDIAGFVEDAKAVMAFLEILPDEQYQAKKLSLMQNVHYQEAQETGLWFPKFEIGDAVKKGELLGEIEDFFGNVLWQYHAEQDGTVLYQWAALPIKAGQHLIAYGY